jgi:hypothetical protein
MGLSQLFVGLTTFVSVCYVTKMSGTAYSSWPIRKVTTRNKLVKNSSYEKSEIGKIDQLTAIYPKLQ